MPVDVHPDDIAGFPEDVGINAWLGDRAATSKLAPDADRWARKAQPDQLPNFLFPRPTNLEDWGDPAVGWGLVLPFRPDLQPQERAQALDAPEPVRKLLEARSGAYKPPVLRYYPDQTYSFTHLRNDSSCVDIPIANAAPGVAGNALPQYLLICGSPAEVPWELQYVLNTNRFVGRLALTGAALQNYVNALLGGWKDAGPDLYRQVIWSVVFSHDDITGLMRDAVGAAVYEAFKNDPDHSFEGKTVFIDGLDPQQEASAEALANALAAARPALVVTTSHGMIGPLDDAAAMKAQLGVPVDSRRKPLDPQALLANWQPDGAVWYAHACCSAGSSAHTQFRGLVDPNGDIMRMLNGVAGLGPSVALLPQVLLGAERPLRAFIGHVEPTFDWTLRQKLTGQFLNSNIKQSLYDNLYSQKPRKPVGFAMRSYYEPVGPLRAAYYNWRTQFINEGDNAAMKPVQYTLLMSCDLQSTVLLGDPTAILPAP